MRLGDGRPEDVTTAYARSTPSHLLNRLLDGQHTWGDLEISDGRYGVSRHRLVVYPPGLSRDQRIPLRLVRTYPMWGLALWVTLQVVLMTVISADAALAISTLAALTAGAAAFAMAGSARAAVRTMTVVRMTGVRDVDILARHLEFRLLAQRLLQADTRRAPGDISAVEHEAEVWRVYDAMATAHESRRPR